MMLWLLAVVFLAAGLWLLVRAHSRRVQTGLPGGRVVYSDTGMWRRCEAPLFSSRYRLTGRPDYLVQERGRIIPVEVKPQRAIARPYLSDILQLGAYCLLVEETQGRTPPYGILKYRDRTFAIDFTPALRQAVLDTLMAIRSDLQADDVHRSHEEPARCAGCGVRAYCDERLC